MCRNLFALFTILGCAIIIPINVYFNLKNPMGANLSKSDAFILMTPTLLYGNPMICHCVLAWVFTLVICFFLWRYFNKVVKIRRDAFSSDLYQNELFARTMMATEIPQKYRSDEGLAQLMSRMKVSSAIPVSSVSAGRDVKVLSGLLKKHRSYILKLESVLAKYLKNPDKTPPSRPTCRPSSEDRQNYSSKVDAIEYYCSKITALEKQIGVARLDIDNRRCLPYGFVSYNSQEECHIVVKTMKGHELEKMSLDLAPRPEDIIWQNIILSRSERRSKQRFGNFLFFCLVVAWIVPNAFMGTFLSQLSRIGVLWKDFGRAMDDNPKLFSFLQGFISPAITSAIFLLLPMIMRKMSHWQGKVTKNQRERDVTLKLYVFFVFNNLFIFTIFSVVWSVASTVINIVRAQKSTSFQQVIDELNIASQLARSIISVSSFWVMYMLRVNFGALLDLLQLISLIWRGFQRHFLSPTPRQRMLWTAPFHFNFAANYNWLLFYSTIAICFLTVQPLIIPVICFYLTIELIFKKYSLLYIYVTKAESDGSYWPLLHNCLLFATGLGNLVVFAVVWVQGGWRIAVAVAPLLPVLVIFKIVCKKKLYPKFYYFIPTPEEREAMERLRLSSGGSSMSANALTRKYQNPAIFERLAVPIVNENAQRLLPDVFAFSSGQNEDRLFMDFDHSYTGAAGEMNTRGDTKFLDGKVDIVKESEMDYAHYRNMENQGRAYSIAAATLVNEHNSSPFVKAGEAPSVISNTTMYSDRPQPNFPATAIRNDRQGPHRNSVQPPYTGPGSHPHRKPVNSDRGHSRRQSQQTFDSNANEENRYSYGQDISEEQYYNSDVRSSRSYGPLNIPAMRNSNPYRAVGQTHGPTTEVFPEEFGSAPHYQVGQAIDDEPFYSHGDVYSTDRIHDSPPLSYSEQHPYQDPELDDDQVDLLRGSHRPYRS